MQNIIRILSAAGLVLSIVSLVNYFNLLLGFNPEGSFCNLNAAFNCDAVNQSAWATIYGTPLASYGGAFYVFVFCLSFLENRRFSAGLLLVLNTASAVFSIYLFYISEFVIGSLCILCVGMYLVNFLLLWTSWSYYKAARDYRPQKAGTAYLGLAVSVLLALGYLVNASRIAYAYVLKQNDFYVSWASQPKTEFKLNDTSLLDKDYASGPADVPVTILEFSDLECAACRYFYLMLEDLRAEYPRKIRLIFKNFPLDKQCNPLLKGELHRDACHAAQFARCAGEQDKFWETVDYIFRLDYSSAEASPHFIREKLEAAYSLLGLNEEAVRECIKSGRQLNKIQSDIKEGQALGVNGTPSVWLNGKRLQITSAEALRSILNGILQQR